MTSALIRGIQENKPDTWEYFEREYVGDPVLSKQKGGTISWICGRCGAKVADGDYKDFHVEWHKEMSFLFWMLARHAMPKWWLEEVLRAATDAGTTGSGASTDSDPDGELAQ
jgi:hypothetical protein